MDQYTEQSSTFRDYVRVLFRQKWVVLVSMVTVVATVYVGLKLKTPIYESQVKILISAEKQVESPYYRDILGARSEQIALTQSEIVKSNPVIERSVQALQLYRRPLDYEKNFCSPLKAKLVEMSVESFKKKISRYTSEQQGAIYFRKAVEDLKSSVEVEPIRDTNIFVIKVKDYSPVGSAITANVVSRSYVIFDLEQQLAELQMKYGEKHLAVKQLKDNIAAMGKSLNGEPISDIEAIGPASVKIVEQAQIPLEPVGPSKILIGILALLMAPFLGIMLAFVFEYMDQTFKTPQEIENTLNLPFLGSIPRKMIWEARLVKNISSFSRYSRSFQVLSDQLHLLIKDKNYKTITVGSVRSKEGTSTIVANLGHYLANKANNKVLLIDADFRSPSLHRFFKVSNEKGLSDVLASKALVNDILKMETPNLHIMPAGRSELNPITLLDTPRMAMVMKDAKENYDIVLVNAPNIKEYHDALLLSGYADGMVLVVSEGRSRKHVAQYAIKPLTAKGVNLIGVILNNRAYDIPRFIYERI